MSWQADIKHLHNKAKSLGVDLSDFESEVLEEDGWYTESNVNTLIEGLLEEIVNLQESLYTKP